MIPGQLGWFMCEACFVGYQRKISSSVQPSDCTHYYSHGVQKCSRSISISSESSVSSNSDSSSPSSSEGSHTPPPRKQVKKHAHSSSSKMASKSKTAKKSKEGKEDPHEEYLVAARGIARCVDCFCKVDKLIKIGCLLQQEEAAAKGELDESKAEKQTRKKRLSAIMWTLINNHTEARELTKVTQKVNTVISATRSDDAACLKSQIGHYAAPIPSDGGLKPAIYNGNPSRSHLGVNHPVLASFLFPVSHLAKFNRDPANVFSLRFAFLRGQKKLASGGICMTANDFPAFLWSGKPPGCDYDDDTMIDSLLQGYLIERLGQDSWVTQTCNAALHDMTTVEAEHIAYAACFGIGMQNKWLDIDSNFKYLEFYHNIINFICDCEDTDWVGVLKKWWNMTLFKNKAGQEEEQCVPRAARGTLYRRSSVVPPISTWKGEMKAYLRTKGLWLLVSGKETRPPATLAEEQAKWDQKQDKAAGELFLHCSADQRLHFEDVQDNPVKIWTTLESTHIQQLPAMHFNAWDDFFTIRKLGPMPRPLPPPVSLQLQTCPPLSRM
ncbi:hypothetical protein DFJ58DRAFT_846209 [Suillus subalutaceus]|uniref:uncharacterized protein n=1 Tax=Suillus subalutaceus TaxID=48586 RepID=UPI001B871651|nr:uncharacterized protein DFJ58DRAFT_846209 [Suillus subalutaceus]KAG1838089.1 hypothetical protein DFJ58DRAFT_846209 [Suillus subalutaceus]